MICAEGWQFSQVVSIFPGACSHYQKWMGFCMTARFAVLDFETTSRTTSARATEIGIVALDDALLVSSVFESVLKPPITPMKQSLSYSRLSLDQLNAAPEFIQIWPTITSFFDRRILVAHKKDFEQNVLAHAFVDSELPRLEFPFLCTLEWSRKILKHQVGGFSLQEVCAFFDIDLLDPHEAKVDAVATANLFRELYERSPELREHCEELASQTLSVPKLGTLSTNALIRRRHKVGELSEKELELIANEIRTNAKIKIVVVTGKLFSSMSKFCALVASVGYEVKESPATAGTAFVVQGYNGGQSKIEKAKKYGRPVLTEQDALKVLHLLCERKES